MVMRYLALTALLLGSTNGASVRGRQLEHHEEGGSNTPHNHTMDQLQEDMNYLQQMDPTAEEYATMKMALMEELEEVMPVDKNDSTTGRRLRLSDGLPSRGSAQTLRGSVECRSHTDNAESRLYSREYWDLNLEAGRTYQIEARRLEPGADIVAELWLGRPSFDEVTRSNNVVAFGDDEIPSDRFGDPRVVFTPSQSGLYTLAISDAISTTCEPNGSVFTHYGYELEVDEQF